MECVVVVLGQEHRQQCLIEPLCVEWKTHVDAVAHPHHMHSQVEDAGIEHASVEVGTNLPHRRLAAMR